MISGQQKISVPEDVFTQSFAMQYITLILFILIFSIGAFLPKDKIQKAEPVQPILVEGQRASPAKELIAEATLARFSQSGMNDDLLAPYISLLQNHDLHLVITIYRDDTNSITVDASVRYLFEYLRNKDLPPESFVIETRYKGEGSEQMHIQVYKGAEAWG